MTATEMKKRVMVLMDDVSGLPRAWGVADAEADALREAQRQLDLYIAKKREVGDFLLASDFTARTEEVLP